MKTGTTTHFDHALNQVKELLNIARHYNQDLTDLRHRLREAENGKRLTEQGIAVPSGTPWRTRQPPSAPLSREHMAEVYAERIKSIDERIEFLKTRRGVLDRLLKQLGEMELRIITLRWIDGKPWRVISMRVYSCERNCQRIQKRAIEKMARVLLTFDQDVYSETSTDIATSAAQNFSRKP